MAESDVRFRHIGKATPGVPHGVGAASGVPHGVGATWGGPHGVCAAMGLRFKTESHSGQRDSSLRERGLLLPSIGTPFAVNRDSFCRQSGLLLPSIGTPFAVIWDSSPPPPFLALDNKTTQRQVFKTTTLPTCLPPKTQRPKDSDFEKYFLRKCGDFPGTERLRHRTRSRRAGEPRKCDRKETRCPTNRRRIREVLCIWRTRRRVTMVRHLKAVMALCCRAVWENGNESVSRRPVCSSRAAPNVSSH
eukprot:COSAG02_NODE_2714_length_8177_cov_32.085417_4_plen_247_part_00